MGKVAKSANISTVLTGRRIKKLRLKKKWTLDDLMYATGIHKTNLGHIENGTGCRDTTLERIAASLDTTLAELKWGKKGVSAVQAYCFEEIISDPVKCSKFLNAERLPADAQKWAFQSLVTVKKYLDSLR